MTARPRAQSLLRNEQGSFLVIGLVGALVLTLLGVALFDLSIVESRLQRDTQCRHRAVHVAEAGLHRAQLDFAATPPRLVFVNITSTSVASLGAGYTNAAFRTGVPDTYNVKVRRVNPSTLRLISTGTVPKTHGCPENTKAVVQVDIVKRFLIPGAPFLAKETIVIAGKNTLTDHFDSSLGSYEETVCPTTRVDKKGKTKTVKAVGCEGSLWSNGEIAKKSKDNTEDVQDGANIYGDVTAAKGEVHLKGGNVWGDARYDVNEGSLVCDKGGCVNVKDPKKSRVKGSVISGVVDAVNPTDVVWPDNVTCQCGTGCKSPGPFSSLVWVQSHISPNGSIESYDEKNGNLTTKGSITVQPGVLCLNKINLKDDGSSALNIGASASVPVVWYAKDQVTLDVDTGNATKKAAFFQLYSANTGDVTDDPKKAGVRVKSGSDMYAYVYAPQTTVAIEKGGDLFGAVVGRRIIVPDDNGKLHFDKGLTTGQLPGTKKAYVMENWIQCEGRPPPEDGC